MADQKTFRSSAQEFSDSDFDRDPPKDLDAEHNFLGALLVDGTLLSQISDEMKVLDADDFASEKNRIVYRAIMNRAASTDDFNPIVISDDLERDGLLERAGGRTYVLGLTDLTGPITAVLDYAVIIRDKARRRRLIRAAETIIHQSYELEGRTVDELYDAAQGLIYKLAESQAENDNGPQPAVPKALSMLEQIESSDAGMRNHGMLTGFQELDELTNGLQPGTLNIVAARPGVGKTSFAMNVVENIAMNPEVHYPALVFSLEMSTNDIILRMLSTFGRVSMRDLKDGKTTSSQWTTIIRKVSLLAAGHGEAKRYKLYIDDSGDITPLELRSRARRLAAENGGLSVIMVDYIQLMKSQNKAENRNLEVGEISRALKLLSKELNVPVIALSQLNREVEGRRDHRPMNSDLRESGSLEQDADMIMFLHRDAVYSHNEDDDSNGKALLIVSKNRNGALKDIELQFQAAYTAFYDKSNTIVAGGGYDVPPPDIPYA